MLLHKSGHLAPCLVLLRLGHLSNLGSVSSFLLASFQISNSSSVGSSSLLCLSSILLNLSTCVPHGLVVSTFESLGGS